MAKHRRKSGARTKSGRLSRAYQGAARGNGTPDLARYKRVAINGSDPGAVDLPQ